MLNYEIYFLILISLFSCTEIKVERTSFSSKDYERKVVTNVLSEPSIEGFYLSFNKVSNVLSILRNDKAILINTIDNALDYFGYIIDDINNDGLLDYRTALLDVDAQLETWYVQDISKIISQKLKDCYGL
jgi:hypothetical protein